MIKEEFRDVIGYEGLYQVSNLGNVKSIRGGKERILKPRICNKGYFRVNISKWGSGKTKRIHQLVAMAFLDHKPNGYEGLIVNHINHNRTDNRLENLELVTQRENANLKHLSSSSKYTGVCWAKRSNKWLANIYVNGKLKHLGYFTNELDASHAYQKE